MSKKVSDKIFKYYTKGEKKLSIFLIISNNVSLKGEGIKRLPIALAQVKTVNAYENLLNEIGPIINSLYSFYRMDTIFMNPRNSKTSDSHRFLLNLSDQIDLKKE